MKYIYPFKTDQGSPKNTFYARKGKYKKVLWNPEGCHLSTDLPAPKGTTILAITEGVVVENKAGKNLGNYLVIRDAYNRDWYYAHMLDRSPAKIGTNIRRGAIIGRVGKSGNASGFHLHVTLFAAKAVGKPWGSIAFENPFPALRNAYIERFK